MSTSDPDTTDFTASCHCGKVVIALNLPDGIEKLLRCNCSLCKRRGAVMVGVSESGLTIVQGEANLTEYRFHTRTAQHFFCKSCGIYTHHRRRIDPTMFGVNVGCIDGFELTDSTPVELSDGTNHPLD